MPEAKKAPALCEIGNYLCPNTGLTAVLAVPYPPAVEWPVVVRNCARCGEIHVVRREDLCHTPVFGYE